MKDPKCRDCGEMILFVEMTDPEAAGKIRALDTVPQLGGTIERQRTSSGKWVGRTVEGEAGVRRYRPHRCHGGKR